MTLRPLVRYLISQGATYTRLCVWLKGIYVQEAETLAASTGGVVTDSQVALLSGVHRKDVARLRRDVDLPLQASKQASLAARVVAEWVSNDAFKDAAGTPLLLPLRATDALPSFEVLVRRTKADLRANVVLDELVRAGVATRMGGGQIKLLRQAYISDQPEEKLEFLGANVGDHMATVVHNLTDPVPWLERAVYYDRIPPAQIDSLRSQLAVLAEVFLRDVNAQVMPLDVARAPAARRLRLGVYYYEENSAMEQSGGEE